MEIVGSIARNVRFGSFVVGNLREASRETFVLEACSVKFRGSLARNDRFGSIVLWNLEEASCETLVLEACSDSVKFRRSIARNDYFENFFCENCRKHRAKRSFWKLVLWKLEEASHETIFLAACSVKFRGSIARNDRFLEAFSVKIAGSIVRNARFGSLFCEISRKARTKRSFWKLSLWKLSEASRETLVLEACSVKFRGSLARNDRFRLWNLVLVAAFSYYLGIPTTPAVFGVVRRKTSNFGVVRERPQKCNFRFFKKKHGILAMSWKLVDLSYKNVDFLVMVHDLICSLGQKKRPIYRKKCKILPDPPSHWRAPYNFQSVHKYMHVYM